MTRIFVTLATLNALALLASFGLGMVFMVERDAGVAAPSPNQPLGLTWFASHMVVGLFTAVLTLLVHCLIFTYFLGTGRWVKEVARAYALPDQLWPRETRELKRLAFPPALFAMLAGIAAVASGAGAQTASESWWGWAHPILAVVTLVLNGWAYVIEYRAVARNSRIMDEVMDEVTRRRSQSAVASGK
jgi:hypothetical protein